MLSFEGECCKLKNKKYFLFIVLTVATIVLGACVDSDHSLANTDLTQIEKDRASNEDESDSDKNREDSADLSDDAEENDEADDADHTYTNSENEQVTESNGVESKDVLTKGEYLEKLNEMEEVDRYAEAGTTIADLEEQETERYEKWDQELNTIYGLLTEQLSTEDMDDLREDQRDWIDYRDETAKESSLEYEGGSTEALEYVATQVTLTRERCYLLVAQYME